MLDHSAMINSARSPQISRRQLMRAGALAGGGLLAAGLPFGQAALGQEASQVANADWPSVSHMLNTYVREGKVANMVAGLGWGQERPQFLAAGDTALNGGISADADSLYRIYSMTKPITGMAVMMCIDDGLISLDQPLAEILPGFANMQVQKVYDGPITADNLEPAQRQITIRHLLTHTAGLGYSIIQQGAISQAFSDRGLVPGQVSRLEIPGLFRAPAVRGLEAFADRLAEMPLVYQPGTKWSYGVGCDLLGRVIEVVTGKAFDAFLQERIFAPCGMTSTWFRVPESEAHRLTANYFISEGELLPIDMPRSSIYLDEPASPFGGAGLVSSARDYDRFLQMLAGYGVIDGVRVMGEPAVRLGTSDLFPDTLRQDGGFSTGGRDFGYGAAGLVGRGDSAGLYGWFGAAGTVGLVNMKYGLRHNLMTQYMPSTALDAQTEFPLAVAVDAFAIMQRG